MYELKLCKDYSKADAILKKVWRSLKAEEKIVTKVDVSKKWIVLVVPDKI